MSSSNHLYTRWLVTLFIVFINSRGHKKPNSQKWNPTFNHTYGVLGFRISHPAKYAKHFIEKTNIINPKLFRTEKSPVVRIEWRLNGKHTFCCCSQSSQPLLTFEFYDPTLTICLSTIHRRRIRSRLAYYRILHANPHWHVVVFPSVSGRTLLYLPLRLFVCLSDWRGWRRSSSWKKFNICV